MAGEATIRTRASDRSGGSVLRVPLPDFASDTCGRGKGVLLVLPTTPRRRWFLAGCAPWQEDRGRCTQFRFAFRRESLRNCERPVKKNINRKVLKKRPNREPSGHALQMYSYVCTVSRDTFARYGEEACSPSLSPPMPRQNREEYPHGSERSSEVHSPHLKGLAAAVSSDPCLPPSVNDKTPLYLEKEKADQTSLLSLFGSFALVVVTHDATTT
jgi:hypothetical protein